MLAASSSVSPSTSTSSALVAPLSAVLLASMSFLAVLRAKSQKARFYINLAIYAGALLTTSAVALGVAVALTLVGKRYNTNRTVARLFYFLASPTTGLKLRLTQAERLPKEGEPAIMVGNHQSFIDILYLGKMFPNRASIMAKKELKWMPFLGWWMNLSGAIWINRGNSASAIKAMNATSIELNTKKMSLFIFPEGTRTLSPELTLKPFKKGAFHLAVQSGLPIVPIVCQNYQGLFDGKSRFDSGELEVRVLEPLPTKDLTSEDVNDLVERTRNAMLAALVEMGSSGSPSSTTIEHPAVVSAQPGARTGGSTAPGRVGTEVTPLLKTANSTSSGSSTSDAVGAVSTGKATATTGAASRSGARSEGETDDEGLVHVSH